MPQKAACPFYHRNTRCCLWTKKRALTRQMLNLWEVGEAGFCCASAAQSVELWWLGCSMATTFFIDLRLTQENGHKKHPWLQSNLQFSFLFPRSWLTINKHHEVTAGRWIFLSSMTFLSPGILSPPLSVWGGNGMHLGWLRHSWSMRLPSPVSFLPAADAGSQSRAMCLSAVLHGTSLIYLSINSLFSKAY